MKFNYWLVLYILVSFSVQAQTNEGTLFWTGFLEHRDVGQNTMVLMITAKQAASGFVRMPLKNWEKPFAVAANGVTIVSLPANAENTGSELVNNAGIQVVSGSPVSVYMHQYHSMRSEATVVLPAATAGKEYYVLTYQGYEQQGQVFPSEFLLVGMEDDTEVQIHLSDETAGGNTSGSVLNVHLNAGETYQVQTALGTGDFTGTFIESDKKINVLAGARWTQVPSGCDARDNLLEQMYPVATWGKQFVTVPHAHLAYDIFRVLASEDQTSVQVSSAVGGTQTYTLAKGAYAEFQSSAPQFIAANRPIAVMQYMIGSGCSGYTVGDPSMTMLNSVQQIRDTVTLYSSSFEAITENYINVITKTSDAGLVSFDGQSLSALGITMQTVGNSGFSYAQIKTGVGAHTLISEGCGLIATAYGYGNVESYAYGGGASFSPLNANPIPEGGCLNDTIFFDTGLMPPRYSFEWDLGDGQSSDQAVFSHFYPALGSYPVSLILHDNCLDLTDTLYQDLKITLRQAVDVQADLESCAGATIYLSATDLDGADYFWKGPGNYISTLQNPTIPGAQPAQSGAYSVIGVISGCATYPAFTEVTVHPLPEPDLGPDTVFCFRLDSAGLSLSPGDYEDYRWSTHAQNAEIVVHREGAYSVQVWDEYGCSAADTVILEALCPTQWYVPNAFSPNDDGWNDSFGLYGADLLSVHLQIYDRWGNLLFETRELGGAWDGYFRGRPVDPGVYVWVAGVEGYRVDGSVYFETVSGDVTLIR